MSVVISITNQKGGVGKTVTVSSIASALTTQGYKVLVINLDPQRNLDMVAGKGIAVRRNDTESKTILSVLRGECSMEDAMVKSNLGDLVRASSQLSQWTGRRLASRKEFAALNRDELFALMQKRYDAGWGEQDAEVLAQELGRVKSRYDYILMDTNPSLTLLTLNSLYAADYVLIPVFTEAASRDAVSELWDTIQNILYYSPGKYLKVAGLLITKYAPRGLNARRYEDVFQKMASKMGTVLFKQKIRQSVSVTEYMTTQMDLLRYDPKGKASLDYIAFVDEFKARIQKMEAARYGKKENLK